LLVWKEKKTSTSREVKEGAGPRAAPDAVVVFPRARSAHMAPMCGGGAPPRPGVPPLAHVSRARTRAARNTTGEGGEVARGPPVPSPPRVVVAAVGDRLWGDLTAGGTGTDSASFRPCDGRCELHC
jgi:hypothetical protein